MLECDLSNSLTYDLVLSLNDDGTSICKNGFKLRQHKNIIWRRALIAIYNMTCCQIFYDKKNSMTKAKNNKKTAGSNRCEFI